MLKLNISLLVLTDIRIRAHLEGTSYIQHRTPYWCNSYSLFCILTLPDSRIFCCIL